MKKLLKHIFLSTSFFLMAFTAMPTVVPLANAIPTEVSAAEITPRADVIYWRHRVLSDGTVQKRRWNETRGCWVDPHWINVN